MLVLTRKLSERILIGDEIVVTVVRINRDQIRLGIDAPRNVRIVRQELLGPPAPEERKTTDERL